MKNYIYCALVATDNYVMGAVGLNYSLQINGCQYPLLVLVTDNCSLETINILQQYKIQYKIVPNIEYTGHYPNRFACTLNKFYLFLLNEYEKICYLDVDIIIVSNYDCIFESNISFWKYTPLDDGEYLISGSSFIVSPNKDIYNYAIENSQKDWADEVTLSNYYFDQLKDIPDLEKFKALYWYHLGGPDKYWEACCNSYFLITRYIDLYNQGQAEEANRWIERHIL